MLEKWTFWLTVWVALMTTFGLGFELYVFFKNRIALKVSVERLSLAKLGNEPFDGFAIKVKNIGGKSLYIRRPGIKLPSGESLYGFYLNLTDSSRFYNPTETIPIGECRCFYVDLNRDYPQYKDIVGPHKVVAFVYEHEGRCFWSHDSFARLLRIGSV